MKTIKTKVTNKQIRSVLTELIQAVQITHERVNLLQLAVEKILQDKPVVETPADPAPEATSKL